MTKNKPNAIPRLSMVRLFPSSFGLYKQLMQLGDKTLVSSGYYKPSTWKSASVLWIRFQPRPKDWYKHPSLEGFPIEPWLEKPLLPLLRVNKTSDATWVGWSNRPYLSKQIDAHMTTRSIFRSAVVVTAEMLSIWVNIWSRNLYFRFSPLRNICEARASLLSTLATSRP